MKVHPFTQSIVTILETAFPGYGKALLEQSNLLQYLNEKTRSATRGSKSRGSFANHYALYVLVEDYVQKGFDVSGGYSNYEGAQFSQLFTRQRQLPFGSKLQNHALNSRLNDEFSKYFPTQEHRPIIRDLQTQRYWINEQLLVVAIGDLSFNIARSILDVIGAYVETKRQSFDAFIEDCQGVASLSDADGSTAISFVANLLRPEVDARIFEIVSYAVLKEHYSGVRFFWGWKPDAIGSENLQLFKTGRTNANDGGIDFVMRPWGRFFQVTETLDVKKYFLDIEKIQRFPLTFVVKSAVDVSLIRSGIEAQARQHYSIAAVVARLMSCIEEIINVPMLVNMLSIISQKGKLRNVLDEIIRQSKVEFNYDEADDSDEE